MTEQLELIKKQSRYKIILSTLFNTSVGSLSFLLAMLMASVIALVILFCFFNVMLFIITIFYLSYQVQLSLYLEEYFCFIRIGFQFKKILCYDTYHDEIL